MKPQLAWYIKIGNAFHDLRLERQFLYYAEKPHHHFVEGKPKPIWDPITIEIPTRTMDSTKAWLASKDKIDITLEFNDQQKDKILAQWVLKSVEKVKIGIRKSKVVDQDIIYVLMVYEGTNVI